VPNQQIPTAAKHPQPETNMANQRGKMTIYTTSSNNSIMSFLSQFPELQTNCNISSVSLFSPNSPKTIVIMPKPTPTDDASKMAKASNMADEWKKTKLLDDLAYKERIIQKRLQNAAD
jgi:hypothetical protein